MKAYFIGGSQDLTCRQIDDQGHYMRVPKSTPVMYHPNPPLRTEVTNEIYKLYRLPDNNGREIHIYVFEKEE